MSKHFSMYLAITCIVVVVTVIIVGLLKTLGEPRVSKEQEIYLNQQYERYIWNTQYDNYVKPHVLNNPYYYRDIDKVGKYCVAVATKETERLMETEKT